MLHLLLRKEISKFENKNNPGNQETAILTLQPFMVSV